MERGTAMTVEICEKPAFSVIGRLGTTSDGPGFIPALWKWANDHFAEIAPLVKRDPQGTPAGFWGAMSDLSGSFAPWEEDFTRGLYLAGAEAWDDVQAPAGWTKWDIPGFVYLKIAGPEPDLFRLGLEYLRKHGLSLAGAVHDFTDPQDGGSYQMFPIRRLEAL